CDDRVCDPSTAASFVKSATTVPAAQKSIVMFVSDAHGKPALKADHMTPLTWMGVDALDTWGTWRLDDALRAYALTGSREARAPASRLTPSERLGRPAPAAVPLAAAWAVGKVPVLVVISADAKSATLAALDAASPVLTARGIAVVRVASDSPLAADIDVRGDP